jgi:hypothetical protein
MPPIKTPENYIHDLDDVTIANRAASISAPADTEQVFQDLVDTWQHDTMFTSSIRDMVSHPAYQRIAALGSPVVPLLLRQLQHEPAHWFSALRAITGENPAHDSGTFDEAVNSWLNWGRARGYIS